MFPGQFKVLRIKHNASFQSLLGRNCAIPLLTEKSSRGVLLSNLTWKWTAGGHTPKALLHNETELWLQQGTSLLKRLLVTCPQVSIRKPTSSHIKWGNKMLRVKWDALRENLARSGTPQVSPPAPINYTKRNHSEISSHSRISHSSADLKHEYCFM